MKIPQMIYEVIDSIIETNPLKIYSSEASKLSKRVGEFADTKE